jgi:RNA polymerase sigma factor (sigma-70 family)
MIAYTTVPTIPQGAVAIAQTISVTREELEQLYFEKYIDLVRCARLLVDDVSTASDVVQEAFVKALASNATFHSTDPFTYMKTAVMNQARSTLRKRAVSRKHLSSVPLEHDTPIATKEAADLRVDAEVVSRALAALPTRQRECIALSHTMSMTHREIALQLGISEGSVKQHISRGIEKLHTALKDEQ